MSGPAITFELVDGVARLTLARPETRNAIGPEVARALHAEADRCAAIRQHVVVLSELW